MRRRNPVRNPLAENSPVRIILRCTSVHYITKNHYYIRDAHLHQMRRLHQQVVRHQVALQPQSALLARLMN